jgi:hypothetical protein
MASATPSLRPCTKAQSLVKEKKPAQPEFFSEFSLGKKKKKTQSER